MSNSCKTPLPKITIDEMIQRHVQSYYLIGDLYEFITQQYSWQQSKPNFVSPILDLQINFDYENYIGICQYGNSISKSTRYSSTIPGTKEYCKPYEFSVKFIVLCDGKKAVVHEMKNGYDPITSKSTMFTFFKSFAESCMKKIKRLE